MVALSFQRQFVDLMLAGVKDQSIRATRRGNRMPMYGGHAAPGDALQLYVGMRTRQCALIVRTVCIATVPVTLRFRPVVEFTVAGERVAIREMDAFARRDGFDDCGEMELFWSERHPRIEVFAGWLIRWQRPATPAAMGDTIALPEAA